MTRKESKTNVAQGKGKAQAKDLQNGKGKSKNGKTSVVKNNEAPEMRKDLGTSACPGKSNLEGNNSQKNEIPQNNSEHLNEEKLSHKDNVHEEKRQQDFSQQTMTAGEMTKIFMDQDADNKERFKIVTRDLIREMVLPSQEMNKCAIILPKEELQRLHNKSKVISMSEKQQMQKDAENRVMAKKMESQKKVEELKMRDRQEAQGARLSEFERDARRKTERLQARALRLQMEQEEEIKEANRIILGTKCHAIRDAQIAEKMQIQKELEDEDKRIYAMMEEKRQKDLKEEERHRQKVKAKRMEGVQQILDQIKENETAKVFAAERLEQEQRVMKEAQIKFQMDELENLKRKVAEQDYMKKQLLQVNKQIEQFRELERAEDRLLEMKVQEFMRQKAEREAANEAEQNRIKAEKEKEIARLQALQQRMADTQAEKDELNARRAQEEVERAWRKKEREQARLRLEDIKKLNDARAKQINDLQKSQLQELLRDRKEIERRKKAVAEAEERERQEQLRKQQMVDQFRTDIRNQIHEKEKQRIEERQKKFEEVQASRIDQERRTERVKEVVKSKIEELRFQKVPEIYVKEVVRQLSTKM